MGMKNSLKKVLPLLAKSTHQEFSKLRGELTDVQAAFGALDTSLRRVRVAQEGRLESLDKRFADRQTED